MTTPSQLLVDTRYGGLHGIGRYAEEVIPRLTVPWASFAPRANPTSPTDLLSVKRVGLPADALLYSPGFSVGPARCRQIPTVHDLIHIRSPAGRKGLFHKAYYERVLKPVIRNSKHVITVSETSANDLREWLADDSVTVHNAGNGCSTVFSAEGPRHESARPYFLMVGNFKAHKNPQLALAAMREFPDHDLLSVTSDRDEATQMAAAAGIVDRFMVMSGVDDPQLAQLYRGADALLFPSRIEGFGLPALEALKCGTPVVYLETCASVKEICEGGQFPVNSAEDVDGFAEAMQLAHTTPFLQAARVDTYRWDSVAASVDRTLGDIANY